MASDNNDFAYGETRIVEPRETHKATIVWLHNFGETCLDSARFVRELELPNVKWICPTAPTRPISILGGLVTTSWCNVTQVSNNVRDDELVSINITSAFVANLLAGEPGHVTKGVGGRGVGAAQALYFASSYAVGGTGNMGLNVVVAINGWLPARSNFEYHINSGILVPHLTASLPILLTNEANDMVPQAFRDQCHQTLTQAGFPVTPMEWWDPTFARIWLQHCLQLED